MTNGIALALGAVIVAALAANFAFGWEAHVFLARKLGAAIEWLAFWR